MNPDIKTLSKLIALCRKTGVSELELDGIKFKLSPSKPQSAYKKSKASTTEISNEPSYTEEETLFWSAQGVN